MNTKTAQQIAIAFKRGLAFIRGITRMAQDADPDEKWITIGAHKNEDGESSGGRQTLITPVNHINLTQAEDLIDRAEKVLASVRKNEKLAPATEESITMEPVDFRTMRDRLDRVGARKITIPGVSEVMTSNGAWGSNGKRERFILGKDAIPEELIRYSTRWVTIGRGARIMVDSNGTIRAGLGGKYNGRQFADVFKARAGITPPSHIHVFLKHI